jgi:alpha-L-fucosidase
MTNTTGNQPPRLLGPEERRARLAEIDRIASQGPFTPSWDSLESYSAPAWYEDGKFGIFIHWGVYSVPAFGGEWYPRQMYLKGHGEFEYHVATFGPQDRFGYKDFIPMFKGERFDPAEWAELFRDAGAKFVVPVAEHHDGFQMYGSALSRWNSVGMGPCREIVGELGEAVRERGMTYGVSSHRAEHFWFMGGGREFPSDVQDPDYADFYGPAFKDPARPSSTLPADCLLAVVPDAAFLDDWLLRTCELIDLHRPGILWFDWWIQNLAFKPYLKRMASYYYNRAAEWGIGVAINYKYDAFPTGTAVFDVERGQLGGIRGLFWQTDTAVQKNSWGYTENQDYKTAHDILCDLVDIVAKNGALLLNVGPKADGTIPEPERRILLEIGTWLRVNGEAIYGTRPFTFFGEGPTEVKEGAFTDTVRPPFTPADIRFTTKGAALYAIALACPEDGRLVARKLAGRPVASVMLLDGAVPLRFESAAEGLIVHLPAGYRTGNPIALKIL